MAGSNGGWSVSARVREIVVSREEKSKGGVRKCEERWSNCGEDVGPPKSHHSCEEF